MLCDSFVKRTIVYIFPLALAMITIVCGCNGNEPVTFTGRTMGTVYHVTVIEEDPGILSALPEKIADRLESINASMSMFDKRSELSRFNARPKGDQFCVSDSLTTLWRSGAR